MSWSEALTVGASFGGALLGSAGAYLAGRTVARREHAHGRLAQATELITSGSAHKVRFGVTVLRALVSEKRTPEDVKNESRELLDQALAHLAQGYREERPTEVEAVDVTEDDTVVVDVTEAAQRGDEA